MQIKAPHSTREGFFLLFSYLINRSRQALQISIHEDLVLEREASAHPASENVFCPSLKCMIPSNNVLPIFISIGPSLFDR